MGIWFLLNVIVFFAAGAWSLYSLFQSLGPPRAPGDILNTPFLLGLFMILTAAGLMKRNRLARAAGVALCFWMLFLPAAIFLSPYLSQAKDFSDALNSTGALGQLLRLGPVVSIALVLFSLKSLQMYSSASMDDAFNAHRPPWWKVLALLGLLLLISSVQKVAPKGFHQNFEVAIAKQGLKVGAQTPAMEVARQRAAPAGGEQRRETRGVRACRISLDEHRLLLVSDDGQGHIVDLRSGRFASYNSKIEVRAWPASFGDQAVSPIGPDADLYFDSDRSVIARFTDVNYRYGIGGGTNRFVAFTSSPNQIVVLNRDSKTIRRLEIPIGTVVWSSAIPPALVNTFDKAYVSPDYTWMLMSFGDKRTLLVGMRDGRVYEVALGMEHLENVLFSPKSVLISGVANKAASNFLMELPSLESRGTDIKWDEMKLVAFDEDRKVMLGYGPPSEVKNFNGENVVPTLAAPVLYAAVLNPDRYLVAAEEGQSQMNLIDLDAKTSQGVGRIHEARFQREQMCFTISATRRIFALAMGDKVEIFWSAYLAPGQFRSVVLNLPIK